MKILHELPPNYPQLCAAFPVLVNEPDAIFAYGEYIYVPSGRTLPPYKIAHEEVHGRQQLAHSSGVEGWWDDYIKLDGFRLREEIPAHHADYIAFCKEYKAKQQRHEYLFHLAGLLSSDLYGNIITRSTAMSRIRYGK